MRISTISVWSTIYVHGWLWCLQVCSPVLNIHVDRVLDLVRSLAGSRLITLPSSSPDVCILRRHSDAAWSGATAHMLDPLIGKIFFRVYANSHRTMPGQPLEAVAVMPVSRAPTNVASSLGLELAEMRMGEVVLGDMIVIDGWPRPMQRLQKLTLDHFQSENLNQMSFIDTLLSAKGIANIVHPPHALKECYPQTYLARLCKV
ncbi:hypothetical protein CcaCcLH18_11330 [Colletotrichum camelliae]|nr:hypothetical protein CcaCcLH18_11330 [Colletotrichum camelliae]